MPMTSHLEIENAVKSTLSADRVEFYVEAGDELSEAELNQVSGGGAVQDMMSSIRPMGEILSNVSKTRSEISMTFARNARA